jgi:hypothetical protein
MAVSTAANGAVFVDLREFHDLAINLRAVEPELYKALSLRLRGAGRLVADEAKKNASYSSEIQAAIKVRLQGLQVTVGVPYTPIHLMEEYKKAWRHPLFGDKNHWYGQIGHPYLQPALQSKGEEAALEIEAGVNEALDTAMAL